jgi:hypothetical protein
MSETTEEHNLEFIALMDKLKTNFEVEKTLRANNPGSKHYFNNFFTRLPGGSSRSPEEMDLVGDISFGLEVRQGKTNREFFAEIDRIATKEHIPVGEIIELQRQLAEIPTNDPLQEGYTDQDLIS